MILIQELGWGSDFAKSHAGWAAKYDQTAGKRSRTICNMYNEWQPNDDNHSPYYNGR